jgi:NAD(P)H-quinone oxidoreductase subunit 4
MLLSGVVSKLGAYGLLRFGVGFLGDTWVAWSPWIAAAGALSAIYGALNAIGQGDIRRLMAYSSLGHMGLLVLGLAAATPLSLQGSVAQMLAHGLIVALLFACVGLIERKTGTSTIAALSGLLNPLRGLPLTLALLLLALMAAAGIPGLAAFPAELLVFVGSWSAFPQATLVALVASGLTAVYAVRLFNRVGFGRLDNQRADWPLTSWAERAPLLLLAGLVVATGLWPRALTGWAPCNCLRLTCDPWTPLGTTATALISAAPPFATTTFSTAPTIATLSAPALVIARVGFLLRSTSGRRREELDHVNQAIALDRSRGSLLTFSGLEDNDALQSVVFLFNQLERNAKALKFLPFDFKALA